MGSLIAKQITSTQSDLHISFTTCSYWSKQKHVHAPNSYNMQVTKVRIIW